MRALTIFLGAGLVALALPALAASSRFDGAWAVRADTTTGQCQGSYDWYVTIKGGRIAGTLYGNRGSYKVTGAVGADGGLEMRTEGESGAVFTGKAAGGAATGTWSTGLCGGPFEMRRK